MSGEKNVGQDTKSSESSARNVSRFLCRGFLSKSGLLGFPKPCGMVSSELVDLTAAYFNLHDIALKFSAGNNYLVTASISSRLLFSIFRIIKL